MVQVERHEDFLQLRHGTSRADRALAETVQGDTADIQHAVQFGARVGPVRPLICPRVRRDILVGEETHVLLPGLVEDPLQLGRLVRTRREDLVAVPDRDLVPLSDVHVVDLGIVETIAVQRDERMRIVQHRDPPRLTVVVVVRQSQRVPDLVRGQLPNPRQRPLRDVVGGLVAVLVGGQQSFGDQVVLAHAQRAERDVPLQDLARARVGDRSARAPAPGRAMHPVDHVIAHVVAAHVLGPQLDPEGVDEPGGLERLVPPAGSVQQRRTHRFRGPGIEVVDDGLDGLAHRGRGIPLLQPMSADEALRHRLAERGRVVLKGESPVSGARIVGPRRVLPEFRKLDEGVMHPDRGRGGGSRHVANPLEAAAAEPPEAAAPAALPHEGQRCLHFGVLREVHHHRQVHRAPASIEPVGAGPHPCREPRDVLQEERREVDQHAVARFGPRREPPQGRWRKRVLHGPAFGRVVARRAKPVVGLDHQHLGPHAMEAHDPRTRELPAVDADVVGPQAGTDPGRMENIGFPLADLQPYPAGGFLPIERHEAVHQPHGRGLLLDRGQVSPAHPLLASHSCRRRGQRECHGECAPQAETRHRLVPPWIGSGPPSGPDPD